MVSRIFKLLVIVTLLAASQYALPQTSEPGKQGDASTEVSSLKSEIDVLKERLDGVNQSNDKILQVVYWSLGTCVTIAILLVGYGWFSNFRMYERDRNSLERELKSLTQERTDAIEVSLRNTIQNSEKNLKDLVGSEIKKATSSQLSSLRSEIKDVLSLVNDLRIDEKIKERSSWIAKDLPRNALSASVEALEMAIEQDDDYQLGDVLDLVSKDMASCAGRTIDNFLVGRLVESLDKVKGHHAQSAANLKQRAPLLNTPV